MRAGLATMYHTFVLLKPGTDIAVLMIKLKILLNANTNRNDVWTHFLFPLKQWHLYPEF